MNTITQAETSIASGYTSSASSATMQDAKNTRNAKDTRAYKESQASESKAAQKTSRYTDGKTIGTPELSEAGKKYYEQLKKKYGNMDFILVSEDMKEQAQANAGKYANPNRMVVLIDTDKIERMAVDEEYRKQYEGVISSASRQLPQIQSQIQSGLGVNAGSVKSYGMKIDDGGNASFFAVIDKSLTMQRERIEKNKAEKKEEAKQDKKAADQKKAEEKRSEKAEDKKKAESRSDDDTVTVTAASPEELVRKINDTIFQLMSDSVRTEMEKGLGQNFDFSI